MTFKFACPKCQKSIKATSELAGKVAKCPGCGAKLKIPTPKPAHAGAARSRGSKPAAKPKVSAPAPADDGVLPFDDDDWDNAFANPFAAPQAEDEPSKVHDTGASRVDRKSLQWSRRGLKLVNSGLQGMAFCIILMILFGVVGFFTGEAAAGLFAILALAPAIGIGVCGLLLVIGPYFCVTVPEKTGARPAALRSAAAQTANIGLSVTNGLGVVTQPTELLILGVLSLIVGLVSYFSFLSFMETLATYIRRTDIAESVARVKILGAVIGVCYALLIAIGAAGDALEDYRAFVGFAAFGLGLTLLVCGIMALVGYARSVNRLSKAL